VLDARRTEITEELRHVLIEHMRDCLQFDEKSIFKEKVGKEAAEDEAIFVTDLEWMLLDDPKTAFPQSMNKGIFIDLFHMPAAQITMDRKTRLADNVAQLKDINSGFHF
jgi:hypothetical protein